ncbi:MAG: hypothetical protein JW958_01155 [Candidatus Eisenbacteria bacterium]|nr:hypothetical protein [Candidatus Eisenbacteria bacterium]
MSLLYLLVPAAAVLALVLPLLRAALPAGEAGGSREERERAFLEILGEIDDDRDLGLLEEEDREEFLRHAEEEEDRNV